MKKIEDIDKNFQSRTAEYQGMKVFRISEEPFRIYGLLQPEEGKYERIPQKIADLVNGSVKALNGCTSGGRIRFKTDSKQIIVSAVLPKLYILDHMPLTGTSCFDLYVDGNFVNVFRPQFNLNGKDGCENEEFHRYDAIASFSDKKMRDILIHFPLYKEAEDVVIALTEDAVVLPGEKYLHEEPVVFYGSSITQGACASHAGNCYAAMISRKWNCDYINLGFSGGCFAEDVMAYYISSLEMGIFVYDYDHNAGDSDFLEKTHERFFQILRSHRPNVPVIIVSGADPAIRADAKRKEIIRRTYENAVQNGDKNVFFVDGSDIYREIGVDYCTVDNIHPNDLGFWCMAQSIGAVIEKIYKET